MALHAITSTCLLLTQTATALEMLSISYLSQKIDALMLRPSHLFHSLLLLIALLFTITRSAIAQDFAWNIIAVTTEPE
jgi:hypothetical protein